MTRAVISIGVSKAFSGSAIGALLPELPGAVGDAERMAQWARKQKYDYVNLFTDAAGPVEHGPIYEAVKGILADKGLERLIIFFAGHGYSPAGGGELLLLSNWEDDGNEAINVTASVRNAQRYTVPQISIIADACRTTFNTPTPPIGQLILPTPKRGAKPGNVDRFFATHFGDPAQEVAADKAKKNYGIFSEQLFRALEGRAAAAQHQRNGKRVITSLSLEKHLDFAVPDACGAILGAVIQYPETIPEWKEPDDIYLELDDPGIEIETRGPTFEVRTPQIDPRVSALNTERAQRLVDRAGEFAAVAGRASFETHTGVSVIGARIVDVVDARGDAERFQEGTDWHVRMPGSEAQTILIQIQHPKWDKHWLAVATFPGLVAAAKVDDMGFSSLNYRRAGQPGFAEVETQLAEATALLESGRNLRQERVETLVHVFRNYKGDNPALGVIAAYLCDAAGMWETIGDMLRHEFGGGAYTPYDLLLLRGGVETPQRRVVGSFPLFSRGWSVLPSAETKVPIQAHEMRRYIAPSLWTMSSPEGGSTLRNLLALEANTWLAAASE